MPLARSFFFVGGVLLSLLFIVDAVLPKLPVSERADAGTTDGTAVAALAGGCIRATGYHRGTPTTICTRSARR